MYACVPVCTRYAHPATCFSADPRGYAYAFPRRAYCCRDGLCLSCVQTGCEKHLKYVSSELYQMYEWSILSSTSRVIDAQF